MKFYILCLLCLIYTVTSAQNPLTCQTITENFNRITYSSSDFEYDSLGRKTVVNIYSDFTFKNLQLTQKLGYTGNLKSSNQSQYFDTLGNVVWSRNYVATPNEDCKLDINY